MTRQTELNLIDEMTEKLAQLKLAEQSINDLTATCRKQETEIFNLRSLLVPFSQPDLCRILSGNTEQGESIVFQRDNAILKIKHFQAARAAIEATKGK